MGTVTYPDLSTGTMVNEYFVPIQIDVSEAGDLVERYSVVWTPNIYILMGDEKLIYHVEGWFPPNEFLSMLTLACGHYFLKNNKFEEAGNFYKEVRKKMPRSQFAAEALYYLGVAKYLDSHNLENLKDEWINLQRFYPDSLWSTSTDIL